MQQAQVHYNDAGTPVSDLFGDIYFSDNGGLDETDYVFLHKNQLPERWFTHSRAFFHIAETGFGTGLNFLLTWLRFRQYKAQSTICQRLYFSSFEKYPLSKADLTKALATWPQLAELTTLLIQSYPVALPGPHRMIFDDGSVVLDLWLGDVNELLPQVPEQNKVDAWFLDGFAPSKNPDMWQQNLFNQMFRLSHSGTTASTFTCAGFVRRGLNDAGFSAKKTKGHGQKREMLIASAEQAAELNLERPDNITVIGAGVAGINAAFALRQKGLKVQLLCADAEAGMGASHNRQGAVYPNLHATYDLMSSLSCQSFLYARQFYASWLGKLSVPADWCGVLTLACNDNLVKRQHKIQQQPFAISGLFRTVTKEQASDIAGLALPYDGLFFPTAGWLCPQQYCQQMAQWLGSQGVDIHYNAQVQAITPHEQHCMLETSAGTLQATTVVLATGAQLNTLDHQESFPLRQIRGQVSHLQSQRMTPLKTVVCHQGYITPAYQQLHCVGATFDRSSGHCEVLAGDDQQNLDLVNKTLNTPDWFMDAQVMSAKAGLRATVPDHMPVLGQQKQLWRFGALGARGLTWAPLLAEVLACLIAKEPLPLTAQQLDGIDIQRYLRLNAKDG
ncbi:bifunctional tRNA (5-methylaminomethyl-2-thiouridine)(34)-methyltransferase MnmD/FAD-dependent 5-carboxymethylaminomethyl-2-thiouridine(34) oxidoreductase MnmC [Rheinheimera sp. 1928-s]|uniref:bifunctional tRNA (5-methylaminomethyl-2-thiouridine)(34)-methyltransferase MnmD/FAD-dependent 5-carboxymethylaminomethyl-2-thiouridine(34) oxidoreductase MnmC n=1 Tax=Rheinheimera sp. 1928-s TaxID=3033803 RepID=UPI00260B73D7|nr:bifunctional tRNA (5-methylaminomethyl-2-thiouridine)(34)-methyltransferase MnmD/FAD-dependent 5-carboxymethylaminomethyl-2-thiouridine(34) oxidoreductase MnmC [Rheinheimera sp. 1928-s]MDF3126357.1 bifunctional tRNA (5-methylaminomethyl-2-thiouridine)(34)-methyltransferase MnmD/FAD-dependent 5-carboxymethylaminomethyl-2-thiouridine(34) oxidoreductase MnmC [Rheinheimera sp. 1928-s]